MIVWIMKSKTTIKTTIAMKKSATLLTFLAFALGCFAQQGEIIYTQFEPDWCLESIQYAPADTIKLDFDGDGTWDFAIRMFWQRYIDITFIPANGWEYRARITDDTTLPPAYQHLIGTDTLIPNAPLGWEQNPDFSRATYMCGVRKVVNDSTIYYGWFDQYWINATIPGIESPTGQPIIKEYQCVRSMAFCTIPNYPLRWGQTSLIGVEEKDAAAFASVHPNPTNGQVTITGKGLRQAEVVNTLGQRVATATGQGETLQADLGGLPAGVYFVNVTDGGGRKCVRKVVKE